MDIFWVSPMGFLSVFYKDLGILWFFVGISGFFLRLKCCSPGTAVSCTPSSLRMLGMAFREESSPRRYLDMDVQHAQQGRQKKKHDRTCGNPSGYDLYM